MVKVSGKVRRGVGDEQEMVVTKWEGETLSELGRSLLISSLTSSHVTFCP